MDSDKSTGVDVLEACEQWHASGHVAPSRLQSRLLRMPTQNVKRVCDELAWAGALGPFNGLHVDGSTHAQPAWLVGLQGLRGHGARCEETEHGAGLAHPQLLNLEANQ